MPNWKKREKEVIKSFGLKPVPLSGADWTAKEDGESDKILAQLKSSIGKSISVKAQDIRDLVKHSRQARKMPVMILDFVGDEPLVVVRAGDLNKVAKFLKWNEEMV
jgi:Holliday junction resolvase